MVNRLRPRTVVLILADVAIIAASVLAALVLRLGLGGTVSYLDESNGLQNIVLATFVCITSLYFYDLYDYVVISNRRERNLRLIQALGSAWILLALLFYFLPALQIGRGTALYSIIISLILLLGFRSWIHFLFGHPQLGEKILIVGEGQAVAETARVTSRRRDAGYRFAGFVSEDLKSLGNNLSIARNLGTMAELEAVVEREGINSIVVDTKGLNGSFPDQALLRLRLAGGVSIEEFPSFFERVTGRVHLDTLHPSWVIFSHRSRDTQLKIAFRVATYRLLALVGLIISLPIAIVTAIMIKLESEGPILYRQQRVGRNGRVFELIKFRSMRVDAEKSGAAMWASPNDGRATMVGRVIRKIRVDEIPQFWNILKGDMSFIGPRPERPQFVCMLADQIQFYDYRHLVAPGLTGWAQINYPYGASVEDAKRKLEYDLYYIKNQSFGLDVIILFETVKTILFGRGSR